MSEKRFVFLCASFDCFPSRIKLLDFAAETDADALLALEPEERSKKKNYDEIEKARSSVGPPLSYP